LGAWLCSNTLVQLEQRHTVVTSRVQTWDRFSRQIEFATFAAPFPRVLAPKNALRREDIFFVLFQMIFDVAGKQRAFEKRFCA